VTEVLERLRDAQEGHDLDASSPTVTRRTAASSRNPDRPVAARPVSGDQGMVTRRVICPAGQRTRT
jgi:hypothetical protein